MPPELVELIVKYGYVAIFCFVFFQELGISIFPNEILLIYFGYLTHEGILSFPIVFALVILADNTGSTLTYILFYYFKPFVLRLKPRWIKLPYERIRQLKNKIETNAKSRIFIGRLTPFFRVFTSIIAGTVHIPSKHFITMVFFASLLYSGGFAVAGWFIAPYWDMFINNINLNKKWLPYLPVLIILFAIIYYYLIKKLSCKQLKPSDSYHKI